MGINWGGIADGFTFGLTDFDKQGSSGWQVGGSDWGGYTDAELYQPDWPDYENGGYSTWDSDSDQTTWGRVGDIDWLQDYVGGMSQQPGTQSGTQRGVIPTSSRSPQFSNTPIPIGKFSSSGGGSSPGGANKIGSWYVDPGMGDYLAKALIDQKTRPLQRTWYDESFGSGGGSGGGGGSSAGNFGKRLAGTAIDFLGSQLLAGIG